MCDDTAPRTVELPSTLQAPSLAREEVRRAACAVHGSTAEGAVTLLASELVTNAVLYGAPPVSLTLTCDVTEITVAVGDTGQDPPILSDTSEGLGLVLVDKIARRWGTDYIGQGKVVWCTVPTGVIPGPRRPLMTIEEREVSGTATR